jgi:hypothetical protein
MQDIITVARRLREKFEVPAQYDPIYNEMVQVIGEEPELQTEIDAYQALSAKWKRDGWDWNNDVGAVKILDGERIEFDEGSITITKRHGRSTMAFSLARGERHDRVLWF